MQFSLRRLSCVVLAMLLTGTIVNSTPISNPSSLEPIQQETKSEQQPQSLQAQATLKPINEKVRDPPSIDADKSQAKLDVLKSQKEIDTNNNVKINSQDTSAHTADSNKAEGAQIGNVNLVMDTTQKQDVKVVTGDASKDMEKAVTSTNDDKSSEKIKEEPTTAALEKSGQYQYEVDLVYTWVDGNDPEWLKIRKAKQSALDQQSGTHDSNTDYRFRSHDELRYALRSAAENVPWVRKIFVVTCCGQRMPWLKSEGKVKIIDHDQIIPHVYDPPTFNSNAIEAWVHHIPDLSEQFLLMNDDFFFGAPMKKGEFFDGNGRPRIAFQEDWGYTPKQLDESRDAYVFACHNVDMLLDKTFTNEPRYKILHQAYPVTKSLFNRAHQLFGKEIMETTASVFRDKKNVISFFLAMWTGIYEDKAIRLRSGEYPSNKYLHLGDDAGANKADLQKLLEESGKYKLFCIGDHMKDDKVEERTDRDMKDFFNSYFPNKPAWEK